MALPRLLSSASISTLLPKPHWLPIRWISTTTEATTKYVIIKAGRHCNVPTDDGVRAGLTLRETESALYLQKAMPGLGNDDVKVSVDVDKNTLSIEALGGYKIFLNLPPPCKNSPAESVMKNGELRVVVPKLKTDSPPDEEGQNGNEGEEYDQVVGWQTQIEGEDD